MRSEGLPPLPQIRTLVDVGGELNTEKGVDIAAFDGSASKDSVLRYVMPPMFDHFYVLILNWNHYSERAEWSDMFRYASEHSPLPRIFQNLPVSVFAVFKATISSPSTPGVIKLDEDGLPLNERPQEVFPKACV